jgi:hypothetical protein
VPNRHAVILVLLVGICLVVGCKKSSQNDAPNFFGSPPVVSEVSITKQSKHFDCTGVSQPVCCAGLPWPQCTCCCFPDTALIVSADIDLVQISAKVTDADGAANILVVLTRFFDPPVTGSGSVDEISLEMFDVGSNPVGTLTSGSGTTVKTFPIITGDAVQSDGVYTRYFYMKSDTPLSSQEDCIFSTDTTMAGGTYSQYTTTSTFPASKILNYEYHVEAVDRAGNIASSPKVTLPIVKTTIVNDSILKPCGPPNGLGGCEPPP